MMKIIYQLEGINYTFHTNAYSEFIKFAWKLSEEPKIIEIIEV